MSKTNKEGLTFEEWACAAGVAKFNSDKFVSLSSNHRYNYHTYIRKAWVNGEDPTEWKAALEIRCTGRVLA